MNSVAAMPPGAVPWECAFRKGHAMPVGLAQALGIARRRCVVAHAESGRNLYDTGMNFDEQACLRAARRGDGDAFARVVEYYMPRVYGQLVRMLRRREDAEDLAQETFLRAWRNLDRYDSARPFRVWLYTIAANQARNHLRARGARPEVPAIDTPDAQAPVIEEAATPGLLRQDTWRRIEDALEGLSPNAAALVHLRYREELSVQEAAEILGMKESAAKVALHRARKALRQRLVEDDHE